MMPIPLRRATSLAWKLALLPVLALSALPALGQVQSIALSGMLGNKALLVIDAGKPQALGLGETYKGVRLVSVQGNTAVLEIDGVRRSVRVGGDPIHLGQAPRPAKEDRILVMANSDGRFLTPGNINGRGVQFLIDSTTPEIVLGRADADRLGLKYRDGEPMVMDSANGSSQGWRIKLASVRIHDVEVLDVDATIADHAVPQVVLGRSFLARFQTTRDSKQMLLVKRP